MPIFELRSNLTAPPFSLSTALRLLAAISPPRDWGFLAWLKFVGRAFSHVWRVPWGCRAFSAGRSCPPIGRAPRVVPRLLSPVPAHSTIQPTRSERARRYEGRIFHEQSISRAAHLGGDRHRAGLRRGRLRPDRGTDQGERGAAAQENRAVAAARHVQASADLVGRSRDRGGLQQ